MIDLTSDREVLAATIDGEAEDQSLDGKRAVAETVINRMRSSFGRRQFGDGSARGACLKPWQYSCWRPGADHERIIVLDASGDIILCVPKR